MKRVGEQFHTSFPAFVGKDEGVAVVDYQKHLVGDVRPALLILLGAVGFVLLVACGNVVNLLLARATTRSREIAVRIALGAGRSRLVRQLLTESAVIALAGSGLGLLLSKGCLLGLLRMAPGSLPQFSTIHIDQHVLGFTLAVAFLTTLVFGLAPALEMSGTDTNDSLREGGGAYGREPAPHSAARHCGRGGDFGFASSVGGSNAFDSHLCQPSRDQSGH